MAVRRISKPPRWTDPPDLEKRPFSRRKPQLKLLPAAEQRKPMTPSIVPVIDEVRLFNEAFHRFREGTFGLCEACGGRLSMSRLRLAPFAELCLLCEKSQDAL